MMRRGNLHSHSTYSDGKNSMEEMVLAAIDKGFAYLGFSEHMWIEPNEDFRIQKEDIPAYFEEARRLREVYSNQIEIYIGFESEYQSRYPKAELDFAIGSVHDLRDNETGEYHALDGRASKFERAIEKAAGGDIQLLVEKYYSLLTQMAEAYRPDIIGHLDLVAKNNADGRYFDEQSDWYRKIVSDACEKIASTGCIVELNTGGIARGYRTEPYPTKWTLELLRDLNVPMTISSDAHSAAMLDFWFDEVEQLLRECGFKSVRQLERGKWIDTEL
jgi:histidinol-phosphatase (PHP family)